MTINRGELSFNRRWLEIYLSSLYQEMVEVVRVSELQRNTESDRIKGYGYGVPLLIECLVNGVQEQLVLHTISRNGFGRERRSDRATNLLLDHATFDNLPQHVQSLDVGAFTEDSDLLSLGGS